MRQSPYHPIKSTTLFGKNLEETEIRRPESSSNPDLDREIQEKRRSVHKPLQ
jgi:hypothetical protein